MSLFKNGKCLIPLFSVLITWKVDIIAQNYDRVRRFASAENYWYTICTWLIYVRGDKFPHYVLSASTIRCKRRTVGICTDMHCSDIHNIMHIYALKRWKENAAAQWSVGTWQRGTCECNASLRYHNTIIIRCGNAGRINSEITSEIIRRLRHRADAS